MASVYKKPIVVVDPRTGEKKTKKSAKWWGRYRDATNREKRVPLARDKAAAQAMLNDLVLKVERESAGIADPYEPHRKLPLKKHLRDYERHLRNKNSNRDYVNTTRQRVRDIITACKFGRITDIAPGPVQQFLADLRRSGKSISSSNGYLRAMKMFARWLVQDRRTGDDPLCHLSSMNSEPDRRRVRRPLSDEEFVLLIEAARSGPWIQGIPGPDRAVLYIVAAYTGFRRDEIGSIRRRSFNFESDPPTLTVEAGYSKHRKQDVIPLRADFAAMIQDWLNSQQHRDFRKPLINVTGKRTAEMLRKDLQRARDEWIKAAKSTAEQKRRLQSSFLQPVNEHGHTVDFHALRKTFITNLSRSGVTPKTAQTLARHSDINLTMNTYTMLGMGDQASAVEALPAVPGV